MDTLRYPTLKSWATAVCDAVREKEESTGEIPHQDVPDRIHAIRTRPDEYPGPYTIEPAMEEQVLPTKDKVMTDDLVVAAGYKDGGFVLDTLCEWTNRMEFDISGIDSLTEDVYNNAKAIFCVVRKGEGDVSIQSYDILGVYKIRSGADLWNYMVITRDSDIAEGEYILGEMTYNADEKIITIPAGAKRFAYGRTYTLTILY